MDSPQTLTQANPVAVVPAVISVSDQKKLSDVEKIATTYLKLHKFLFGIGSYVLCIIASIWLAYSMTNGSDSIVFPTRDQSIVNKERLLLRQLSYSTDVNFVANPNLSVIVAQGELGVQSGALTSLNNLLTYKGFTLPQLNLLEFSGSVAGLAPSTTFSAKQHTLRDVDLYLNSIIFTNYKSPYETTLKKKQVLPLSQNILSYFNIQCISYPQFSRSPCHKAFSEFIKTFPVYSLRQNYDPIKQLAQTLVGSSNEHLYCESLMKYIFMSNDTSQQIKDVIAFCGNEYVERFREFYAFRSIEDQLINKAQINASLTNSALLNSYKLVSVMQQLYHEIARGNVVDIVRVEGFLEYVRNILREPSLIQGYYIDIVSRFTNGFLIPAISKASANARVDMVAEYRELITSLRELNHGNSYKNFPGLNDLVSGSGFISDEITTDLTSTGEIVAPILSLKELFVQNYDFPNFLLNDIEELDATTLRVSGRLRFARTDLGITNNSPLIIQVIYSSTNQRFFANAITMNRHPLLAVTINPKLALKALSIAELYDLIISTQQDLIKQPVQKDVCTSFQGDERLVSCSATQIKFVQDDLSYVMTYSKSQGVTEYSVNDSQLLQAIQKEYQMPVTITQDAVSAIQLILDYELREELPDTPVEQTPSGGIEEVQIQKYMDELGASISSITKQDKYHVIEFSIKGYSFVGIYDHSQHSLLGLAIVIGKTNHPIRNFVLNFDKIAESEKSLFASDPATFLLQKDPLTVKKLKL